MMDWEIASLLAVNATAGLSLGLSVTILADVLPGRWVDRRPWFAALMLMAVWLPFALSGDPVARRSGNSMVSLYLCILFVMHIRADRAEHHHGGQGRE